MWALLNKWLVARRARAERLAQLEAQEEARSAAQPPVEEQAAEQEDVGAGDLLRVVSDVAWRMLIIGVVAGLLVYAVIYLRIITLPVIIAVFITALLMPMANWLRSKGLGRGTSTAASILTALVVLGGVITLIIQPAIQGIDGLIANVSSAFIGLQEFQLDLPFGLEADPALLANMFTNAWDQIQGMITENTQELVSG
ncbi:MAG: AI-2E family transporter, partial [Nocardiopsis sp. BM-2018]